MYEVSRQEDGDPWKYFQSIKENQEDKCPITTLNSTNKWVLVVSSQKNSWELNFSRTLILYYVPAALKTTASHLIDCVNILNIPDKYKCGISS